LKLNAQFMKIVLAELKESLVVSEDTEIKARVKGNIVVESNCLLHMLGTVFGHILVKAQAKLKITGRVNGQVIYE